MYLKISTKERPTVNKTEIVRNYIVAIEADTPIFIETIKNLVGDSASPILSKLEKAGEIARYDRGIYYKSEPTIWGPSVLGSDDVIWRMYMQDEDGNIKGYVTGASLFNRVHLSTMVPRMTEIFSNAHTSKNKIEKYGYIIKRPKLPITTENYMYQQIVDIIENKGDDHIDAYNPAKRIREFFNDCELNFEILHRVAAERKMNSENLKRMSDCILGTQEVKFYSRFLKRKVRKRK